MTLQPWTLRQVRDVPGGERRWVLDLDLGADVLRDIPVTDADVIAIVSGTMPGEILARAQVPCRLRVRRLTERELLAR